MKIVCTLVMVSVAFAFVACGPSSTQQPAAPTPASPVIPGQQPPGPPEPEAPEQPPTINEVEAAIDVSGCAEASECALVALGERLCGGPATYRVYCTATTDGAALEAQAKAYNGWAAEEAARQAESGLAGACVVAEQPTVTVEDGRCVATGGD